MLNKPQNDDFELNQEIGFIPLGNGKIVNIGRQSTLTKGKYNLIIEANLEIGQSILVSKLFNDFNSEPMVNEEKFVSEIETIKQLASVNLKPKTFEKLKEYLSKQKRISKEQLKIFELIIKNDE